MLVKKPVSMFGAMRWATTDSLRCIRLHQPERDSGQLDISLTVLTPQFPFGPSTGGVIRDTIAEPPGFGTYCAARPLGEHIPIRCGTQAVVEPYILSLQYTS